MDTLGKNVTSVVREVVTPRKLVAGDGIAIAHTEEGHRISCTVVVPMVDLAPMQENLAGIQAVVEAQAKEIASMSDKIQHTGESNEDAFANQDNDIAVLMTEIVSLKARPAQQILTRTVEKPGMTVHEVKVIERKVPLWVWGVIVAQVIINLVFMVK